eukprot:scpid86653/ scgid6800/ 
MALVPVLCELFALEFDRKDPHFELLQLIVELLQEQIDVGRPRQLPNRFHWLDKKWTSEKWRETFRFQKQHHQRLTTALGLPEEFCGPNKIKWTGHDGLCVVLARLAYPCRLGQLEDVFGCSRCELSVIINDTCRFIYDRWGDLLRRVDLPWLPLSLLSSSHSTTASFAPAE